MHEMYESFVLQDRARSVLHYHTIEICDSDRALPCRAVRHVVPRNTLILLAAYIQTRRRIPHWTGHENKISCMSK